MTRRDSLVGGLYVLAAITVWGIYFPFAKIVLVKLSPFTFVIFRFTLGAAVLALMALRLRAPFKPRRSDLPNLIIAAFIGIVIHQLLQVHGLERTSATNTGWILTLIPPVTGIAGWVFLRERVSLRQVVGLTIAMAAVIVFVSNGRPRDFSFVQNRGDLLALSTVFTWSTYVILAKSRLARYHPLPMTAFQMAIAAVVFIALGAWRVVPEARLLDTGEWAILVGIGIIPSGAAYYWWNAGLRRLSTVNTAAYLFIEAIVASIAGFLLLGEMFTPAKFVAAAFIILGVYITQGPRR